MLALRDNLSQSFDALRAHKLRSVLTLLGLTMGVATLITVMTIVQGANLYVEQKIARLGNDVFQISRTPVTLTDFDLIIKSLRYKLLHMDDVRAVREACTDCPLVGASASGSARLQYRNKEMNDITLVGNTPEMATIDTRTLVDGRYFTETEDERSGFVCLIGAEVEVLVVYQRDFLALVERVRGIQHDPVVDVETLQDFESGAVIAADGERLEMCFMICIHNDGAKSFGTK